MNCLAIWITLFSLIVKMNCGTRQELSSGTNNPDLEENSIPEDYTKTNIFVLFDTVYIKSLQPFRATYNLFRHKLTPRKVDILYKNNRAAINIKASIKNGILSVRGRNSSLLTETRFRVNIEHARYHIEIIVSDVLIVKGRSLRLQHAFNVRQHRKISWCQSPSFDNNCSDIESDNNIHTTSYSLHIANFAKHYEKKYCLKSGSVFIECWIPIQLRKIQLFIPSQNEIEIDLPRAIQDKSRVKLINFETKHLVSSNLRIKFRNDSMYLRQINNMGKDEGKYILKMFNEGIAHIEIIKDNTPSIRGDRREGKRRERLS